MESPKTLFEIGGVKPALLALDKLALVLIDIQREYVDGRLPLAGVGDSLDDASRVVQVMRAAQRPIVHIQHKGASGGLFDPADRGFAIADAVAPNAGETVLTKAFPNAFTGTELDMVLKQLNPGQIVFAGFMTHMCVSSTVRAALDRGYSAAVVASACATRDLPDGQGGVLSAQTLHRAELAALGDRFAVVVPNAEAFAARAGA